MSKRVTIQGGAVQFRCPGCGLLHRVPFDETAYSPADPKKNRPMWTFNGSETAPTLSPSLLVRCSTGDDFKKLVCHSFIRDGKIQFLSDCTHSLAGQTVDLPPIAPAEKASEAGSDG